MSAWRKGEACEAQPEQACTRVTNSPAVKTFAQQWKHAPTEGISTERQCEQSGCMWVKCLTTENNAVLLSSADEMCSQCSGLWEGKCEWFHYSPSALPHYALACTIICLILMLLGFLAFAGPGEYCGFKYPVCPATAGEHCFCSADAIKEIRTGWCNNGRGMSTFCPQNMTHSDGRTQQPCSWNGWTIWPQVQIPDPRDESPESAEACRIWASGQ